MSIDDGAREHNQPSIRLTRESFDHTLDVGRTLYVGWRQSAPQTTGPSPRWRATARHAAAAQDPERPPRGLLGAPTVAALFRRYLEAFERLLVPVTCWRRAASDCTRALPAATSD